MENLWYLSPSDQSRNIGIQDYGSEMEQMNQLLDAVTPHLDRCGVAYHRAPRTLPIDDRPAEANRLGVQYYLALHSNAGGGGSAWGPIAFYYDAGKALAEALVRELLATGQKSNRASNMQRSTGLFELKSPAAAACLLEVDFHDSPVGVDFLVNRREDAARAIAKAIVAIDGRTWLEPDAPQEPDPAPRGLFRVQAGAFAKKANAEAQAEKLRAAGYDAFLRESGGLYRVQAGAFASRTNAEAQAERLKKSGFDAFVSG